MFIYPNAKINIGLNIISKTSDGYHNIESCFCPIDLHDIIELKISNKTSLSTSGIAIPGNLNNNLIIKSIKLFNPKLNYKIHLHKNIPIGSGLGGGSSDATFLLKHLNNNKYSNDFNEDESIYYYAIKDAISGKLSESLKKLNSLI